MKSTTIINARSLLMAAIAIAATLTMVSCMGKDFGDYWKVNTPTAIQQSEGIPAKLSLNDSEYEYGAWFDNVQREGAEWRKRIEGGRDSVAMLRSLAMQLGESAQAHPAIAAVPGLSLLLGYVIKRKGDVSAGELADREKASYGKGRKDVLAALGERVSTTPESDKAAADLLALIKAEIAKAA